MGKRRNSFVFVVILLVCVLFCGFSDKKSAQASGVSASGVCVLEQESGRVLFAQNENKRLPMASTTKIATCITVIERCENLDRVISVPSAAVGVEGSSIYLQRGEALRVIDLLYGLMLQSGNDCAVALALLVGGSVEGFAEMMNQTAERAGATHTNFVNPHGLPADEHFTTAFDLAKITAYAMRNPVFRQIVSTKRIEIPWAGRDYNRILVNKNKLLSRLDGACGVKTGFTKRAGRCLVSAAERDGMTVICVVLNCPAMFEDSERLIENAYEVYQNEELLSMVQIGEAAVKNGKSSTVALAPQTGFSYPLQKGERNRIEVVVSGIKEMSAPVKEGEKNGKVEIFLDKQLIFSADLVTIYKVDEKSIWDKIKDFVR